MKNNKTILVLILIMLALVSCGNKQRSEKVGEPIRVAVILKTLANPFWEALKVGVEDQAKESGITVDIFSTQDENDTQGQVQQFETILGKKYQGIAFAPLSPVNLILPVARAYKQGIYLVNIDEKVDVDQLKSNDANIFSFISTDNVAVGQQGAEAIINYLGSAGGDVAIIEGRSGNISGENRKEGATKAFQAASNIRVVGSLPADWDRTKALDVATNLIQSNRTLKAIYAANDTMALGAMTAVEAAKANVIVVGTDGVPEAQEMVQAGRLYATIAQDPYEIGRASIREILRAIQSGKQIDVTAEPSSINIPSKLIVKP